MTFCKLMLCYFASFPSKSRTLSYLRKKFFLKKAFINLILRHKQYILLRYKIYNTTTSRALIINMLKLLNVNCESLKNTSGQP